MELYMIAPPTPHYTHIILKKYSYYSWYTCLNYVFAFYHYFVLLQLLLLYSAVQY